MASKRVVPLVNNEFYHVFNKSVAGFGIFGSEKDCHRFLELMNYYRFTHNNTRYSYFNRLTDNLKNKYLDTLYDSEAGVEIHAFCLMSNHFHFLLRQKEDGGISNFVSLIQNSFAKYFNLVNERSGSLFLRPFKSMLIESEEQLVHVLRYIHLNPYSSNVLRSLVELDTYKYTSQVDYLTKPRRFITTDFLINLFSSKEDVRSFIYDRADYQKSLELIKHLI